MKAVVYPSYLHGSITAPPSKSAMQRALALALLHGGKTIIENPGISNDDNAALEIIKSLGAEVIKENNSLHVRSDGIPRPGSIIFFQESGLSLRMFAPIIAISPAEVLLTGSGSLVNRPLHFFDEIFPALGVSLKSNSGKLPVKIKGPLKARSITLDGSSGSQYITGLLFAFAAIAHEPLEIKTMNLKSRPYVNLSLQMLKQFGFDVIQVADDVIKIGTRVNTGNDINYFTEGDWSAASFLLVAGAISGNIELQGLRMDSVQADRAIVNVLQSCGAKILVKDEEIYVEQSSALEAFNFDATDCPDLFPPLAVLALYCKGRSVIKGVSRLAGKESDRAASISEMVMMLGGEILIKGDSMEIECNHILKSCKVNSHHDHRIAMAAAVAALKAGGEINIDHAEAVNKSYPLFWKHLISLGAKLSLSS